MNRVVESHRIKPVIDSTFSLGNGAAALRHLEKGTNNFGKVVITL